jgi:hypothetical protein
MARGAMSDRARLFIVPLVVLSVVLVALIVAIVVVAVVRSGDQATPNASPVDPCVVGTWRVTTHREDVPVPGLGNVTFTGAGTGATVRLTADGTGVTDYGTGTRFDGVADGRTIRLDVSGRVTYRYSAVDGRIVLRDPVPEATGALFLDGVRATEVPFTASTDPADYQCSGDQLVVTADRYATTHTRVRQ